VKKCKFALALFLIAAGSVNAQTENRNTANHLGKLCAGA